MGIAEDTRWLDATEQAALVKDRHITAVELVDAAIERIDAHDQTTPEGAAGPINAVVMRWFEHARDQAAAVDAGAHSGAPFSGVPFLLKDLWAEYEGFPMSNGNAALKQAAVPAPSSSTLVERLADAGLMMLGRTNSPELGSLPVTEPLAWGPTRNPWNLDHTCGGSSGGAAAAVAAGMVPIAHASDGGGSIRIPAACGGLVGLKPSQGRITQGPLRTENGFSVQFCVSRSVRDSARLLDAVQGPGVGDTVIAPAPSRPYTEEVGADPGRLRIGLLDHHPSGGTMHPDCAAGVRAAATMLEALGHDVTPGHPSVLDDASFTSQFMAVWAAMMSAGIAACSATIGRELTEDEIEPVNWAQHLFAEGRSANEFNRGQAAIATYRRAMHSWWDVDGWDLLLTPTLNEPPPRVGEHLAEPGNPLHGMRRAAEWIAYTQPFNTTGQPAISLPLGWNDAGLPIGIQLVAAYGREDVLFRVAAQLETAHPWVDRRPPVF